MAKVYALRSLIYGKFNSESEMAQELGWTRQRLNSITNGTREPDLEEVAALADKLDKPVAEIVDIFLQSMSPNEQLA